MNLSKIGAVFYILWGLVHIAGGVLVLSALGESPAAGYANYQGATGEYDALSGAILSYLSYFLIGFGVAVVLVAYKMNWKGSKTGALLNFFIVGFVEVGLVVFLILPGFVPLSEGSVGLVPFVIAAVTSFAGLKKA